MAKTRKELIEEYNKNGQLTNMGFNEVDTAAALWEIWAYGRYGHMGDMGIGIEIYMLAGSMIGHIKTVLWQIMIAHLIEDTEHFKYTKKHLMESIENYFELVASIVKKDESDDDQVTTH
jgi:hypothetical protein